MTSDSSDVGLGNFGFGIGGGNRENLTLSSGPYWNWICECVGGVLLQHVGCSFWRNSLQPPWVLLRRLCPAGSFGNDRVMFLVLYDCGEFLDEGIGSIH